MMRMMNDVDDDDDGVAWGLRCMMMMPDNDVLRKPTCHGAAIAARSSDFVLAKEVRLSVPLRISNSRARAMLVSLSCGRTTRLF